MGRNSILGSGAPKSVRLDSHCRRIRGAVILMAAGFQMITD